MSKKALTTETEVKTDALEEAFDPFGWMLESMSDVVLGKIFDAPKSELTNGADTGRSDAGLEAGKTATSADGKTKSERGGLTVIKQYFTGIERPIPPAAKKAKAPADNAGENSDSE